MNKKFLLSVLIGCLSLGTLPAQEFHLQPTPQVYETLQDSIVLPDTYRFLADAEGAASDAVRLLGTLLPDHQEKADFRITVGVKGDKSIRKYARLIPSKAEGYYLKVDKDEIVIAGADARGAYYGVQTLAQLLTLPQLPLAEITDYPDIPYRGVVEGFYGTPWSHEARLRQLDFYGRNKMNVYLYGPKNDPYHSTPNWRKPYPEREAAQLKELVDKAKENNVIFYWAIHPGQDIKWNEEDRQNLLDKFEKMYQLGVRGFAVFFDDISGEGTKADKQADLLNYLDDNFVKVKGDVEPLIMCPTEYNKAWSNVKGGYLTTLGEKLNKGIQIMWTGNSVIATIDRETMDFINPLLKRKAYIWWNFPVSDYVRDHLLMGPVYGNALDIADAMEGFVSNPMEHAEASKISLYSVADYAWNLSAYDSAASWKRAIKNLMPQHAAYLETFAAHNSDLGDNGHRFRREESVALQPALEVLRSVYEKQHAVDEDAFRQVSEECRKIVTAADVLSVSQENQPLVAEMQPWLMQFKLVGQYGEAVLQMMRGAATDRLKFETAYEHAKALQRMMYKVDTTYNQNPYQPGVKSGSKVLLPTFYALFESSVGVYNQTHRAALDTRAVYMPYSWSSDVPQLAALPVVQKGKKGNVSPSNEVIRWQAGGEALLTMDQLRTLKSLVVDFGTADAPKLIRLEVTADGQNWEEIALQPTNVKTRFKVNVEGRNVLKIRLTNVTGQEQKVYFKQFVLEEK